MKSSRFQRFSSSTSVSQQLKSSVKSNSRIKRYVYTPLDFEHFIPWVCLEYQALQKAFVTRAVQEEYVRQRLPTQMSLSKIFKRTSKPKVETSDNKLEKSSSTLTTSSTVDTTDAVPVKAIYNVKNKLAEVAIINSPLQISRKLIMAIGLCLPFHPNLNKLTIRGYGLNIGVVYEINKLLPNSNITDVCFEDTNVPEGNYYILLDNVSPLKCLSLKRCHINDVVCEKIADRISFGRPASITLCTLDLSFNKITDVGAKALSIALRKNRKLIYLNLAGNKICDEGAMHIFNYLAAFPLNTEETIELKRKRFAYASKKLEVYDEQKKLYELDILKENISMNITEVTRSKRLSRRLKKPSTTFREDQNFIEKATKTLIGEFEYIFDKNNTFYQDGQIFAIGNLKLCYLNLAYNNLGHFIVPKIYEVVKYQHDMRPKPSLCLGLLRIILDGNNMPTSSQLEEIETFLNLAVDENTSDLYETRSRSSLKTNKRKHRFQL